MTNQEAVSIIKEMLDINELMIDHKHPNDFDEFLSEQDQALALALKALEERDILYSAVKDVME